MAPVVGGEMRWALVVVSTNSSATWIADRFTDDSALVLGSYKGSFDLRTEDSSVATLPTRSDEQAFMARIAADGGVVWLRGMGGGGRARIRDAAITSDGDIVAAGAYGKDATFGAGEPNETTLPASADNAEFTDGFVGRFSANGDLEWVKQGAWSSSDVLAGASGTYTRIGVFQDSITFGLGEPNEITLTAPGLGYYIATFASNDALTAAHLLATGSITSSTVFDPSGRIVVHAHASGPVTWLPGRPDETTTAGPDTGRHMAVLSLAPTGAVCWARTGYATGLQRADSLALLSDGSVLTVGTFEGALTLAYGEADSVSMNVNGYRNGFVGRYSPDGALVSTEQIGVWSEEALRSRAAAMADT